MNRFLLLGINALKVILIICFCIEVLAIIGGVVFNFTNPNTKGVSKTDFGQLIIIAILTGILLSFLLFIKKKYKNI